MYTWSTHLVSEYFGTKIAVCFAWMHAVYWYLLVPACGLSLLSLLFRPPVGGYTIGTTTGTTTGSASANVGLSVAACAFPVMSMVFLVWWEQVTPLIQARIYVSHLPCVNINPITLLVLVCSSYCVMIWCDGLM